MDINNLSEHEKAMISVAEGGDPNDPAENAKEVINLPSDKPKEEEAEPEKVEETDTDGDEAESEAEDTKDADDTDGGDDELTEEQKELAKLREEAKERAVYDAIGGKEEFVKLAQWAKDGLNEDQLAVYNQAVNEGNETQAVFAAKALQAFQELDQIKKHGYQGDITRPTGDPAPTESQGYESQAQMSKDMSDRRYQTDPAFRNKVMAKVAATKAGII